MITGFLADTSWISLYFTAANECSIVFNQVTVKVNHSSLIVVTCDPKMKEVYVLRDT